MAIERMDEEDGSGPVRPRNRACIRSACASGLLALSLIFSGASWAAAGNNGVSNASARKNGSPGYATRKSTLAISAVLKKPALYVGKTVAINTGIPSDSVSDNRFGSLESTAGPFPDTGALVGILANPEPYYGNTVTLFGYVSAILDTGAFVLSPTPADSGKGMLVLGSKRVIPLLTDAGRVEVRGEVRNFDRRRYEREVGVGLDVAVFGGWDQGPSLRALWVKNLDMPTAEGPVPKGTGGSGYGVTDTAKADTSLGRH